MEMHNIPASAAFWNASLLQIGQESIPVRKEVPEDSPVSCETWPPKSSQDFRELDRQRHPAVLLVLHRRSSKQRNGPLTVELEIAPAQKIYLILPLSQ